jgi:hypothetical protein
MKTKRLGKGWYVVRDTVRYDYELLNEDGWQLMLYRPGTFKAQRNYATGEAVYAVTHATKADALGHAEMIEDGTDTIEEFPSVSDQDDWTPLGYD